MADKEDAADIARLQIGLPRDRTGANWDTVDAGADVEDAEVTADAAADAATKKRGRGTTIGTITTAMGITSSNGTEVHHAQPTCITRGTAREQQNAT